jgi:hypothetical protein
MGPRAGANEVEKRKILTLPGLEVRPLGHPARNQSLYCAIPAPRFLRNVPRYHPI